MTDLDGLLSASNESPTVRNSFFHRVYKQGYFPGLTAPDAARQFDADMLADSPRRQHLLNAYLPYHNQDRMLAKKMKKAIVGSLAGLVISYIGVADPKRNEVFELLGPTMLGGCGLMAAGYAVSRKFN